MTDTSTRRPARADARRNYDALLAAATTAFEANGVDTSLEEIARSAGVAIGTLYRHFPTREALVEATLHDEIVELGRRAEARLDHPSPGAALFEWLDDVGAHAATYRGLALSLTASFADETSALHAAEEGMRADGRRLLERAQAAGAVRADVDVAELLTLNCSLVASTEQVTDASSVRRLRDIVYDGLRAG